MIASWMLYALLVSALVAAAARLLEEVCRLRGAPVRWVWLGGLAATVVLVALAPARIVPPASSGASLVLPAATKTDGVAPPAANGPAALLAAARETLARPLRAAATLGDGAAGRALAVGWGALSLALLAMGGATLARAHRARRAWPRREIDGVSVRVAPAVGPAVLGLRRPEVVVPGWLLAAPAQEQRLVVLHEREHITARDPLTLAAGCLAVALLPWNPVAWWMLLRLRLAVELDCDTRVLRGGVPRRAYGTLLIRMAGRGPGLSLGVPALAGTPSTLERRLRAMTSSRPRFAPARAGLLALLGLTALAAACDTPMPTAAEVQAMDASTVQQQAVRLRMMQDGETTYYVDGRQVTAEEANALMADRIGQIEVQKNAQGGGTIRISTLIPTMWDTTDRADAGRATQSGEHPTRVSVRGPDDERERTLLVNHVILQPTLATDTLTRQRVQLRTEVAAGEPARELLRATRSGTDTVPGPARIRVRTAAGGDGAPAPLVVIDGVIVESSALDRLDPNRIDRVEVIKGAAATAQFSDPRAAHGVIRITTKAAAARP